MRKGTLLRLVNNNAAGRAVRVLLALAVALSLGWLPVTAGQAAGPGLASPDAKLSITTGAPSVALGGTMRVNVYYEHDPAYGFYGGDIRLSFDTTRVQVIDPAPPAPVTVTRGPLLSGWGSSDFINNADNTTGDIAYVRYGVNPDAEVFADDVLIYFDVDANVVGLTCVQFLTTTMSTRNGQAIPHTRTDGCFYIYDPTSVTISSFTASGGSNAVTLNWTTASEFDNVGFNLYRATSPDGARSRVNQALIDSLVHPGSLGGATYSFVDVKLDKTKLASYYWLEEVSTSGRTQLHGPVQASLLLPGQKGLPPLDSPPGP